MMRISNHLPPQRAAPSCEGPAEIPPPRTWKVLGLLAVTALIFSYLGSYALADALANAEILTRWSAENDPRPRWMAGSFALLMALFLALAVLARWLSRRQLRAIDAMDDASDA